MMVFRRGVMGFAVHLLAVFARGCIGDQLPTEPEDIRLFTKAIVNSVDGNRSFSENFNSLLAILCPSSVYCPQNGTVNVTNSVSMNAHDDSANISRDFSPRLISEDLAIVISNAEKLHGCCVPCDCDHLCSEKGTCCPAADQNFLPPEGSRRVIQECVYAGVDSYLPRAYVGKAEAAGFSYFMVTDCFSTDYNVEIAAKCRQPELDDIGPVYSPATERIYKNKFCAVCNGDARVISWRPVVTFNTEFSFTGMQKIPSTLKDLYSYVYQSGSRKMLNLLYMPPDDMNTEKRTCILSNGMEKERNYCEGGFEFDSSNFLDRACAFGGLGYEISRRSFANVFCLICYSAVFPRQDECNALIRSGAPSFSATLVGSSHDDVTDALSKVSDAPCDCREYYDKDKNLCRRLMCPPGEFFDQCACARFLQNIHGMRLKIYLEVEPEMHYRVTFERFTTKLNNNAIKSLKAQLVNAIRRRCGPLDETKSILFRETSISDKSYVKIHIAVGFSVQGKADNVELIRNMFTTFQSGVSQRILGSNMTINIGPFFEVIHRHSRASALGLAKHINSSDIVIEPVEPNAFDNDAFIQQFYRLSQTISKLVFCQRVVLEEAEAAVLKSRPRDVGVSPAYLSYVFMEEDRSMCLEDFEAAFVVSSGSNPWGRNWGFTGIWAVFACSVDYLMPIV